MGLEVASFRGVTWFGSARKWNPSSEESLGPAPGDLPPPHTKACTTQAQRRAGAIEERSLVGSARDQKLWSNQEEKWQELGF